MALDPTTNIGKVRLRVGDYTDTPHLPDSVYQSVLNEKANNLPASAKVIAQYILGMLAMKTHRKLAQLEVWGAEAFKNYKEFLILTIQDPVFMNCSPIPYSPAAEFNPILQFQADWNKNFTAGTESQQMSINADMSPNANTRTY